jgi:hypothetical protein
MHDIGIGRRQLLKKVAVGALGAGSLAAVASTKAFGDDTTGIQGAWIVALTPTAGPAITILNGFASGGVLVAQAMSPGSQSNLGAWRRNEDSSYGVTFKNLTYDTTGKVNGSTKVIGVVNLQAADAFSGPGKFQQFDLGGNLVFSIGFTVIGTRVRVEPL